MNEKKLSSGYSFGTFKGVFTPSILTILGVVMYLRLGWVLGQVGLPGTLLIVALSSSIVLLTAFSLSALATNRKVSGGGAYFLISRSFGPETGAAIGFPLYLAQALSIAFYVVGFAESVAFAVPGLDPRTVGLATLCILTLIAWFSADLAMRTQYVILALIMASLVSFFLGSPMPPGPATPMEDAVARFPFWAVFAVFFPAVTGIEAGLAMSGDLRNPSRSLPRGTLLACLTGTLVYLAIPVVLSRRVTDPEVLIHNPLIIRETARWGLLIVAGIWGASLSSAVGAMLGAPRTLQALGRDGAAPRFLARGFGRGNDPRLATAVSFGIALIAVWAGGLNVIAPVLSMFFLTSYGFLNLAAAVETLVGGAQWRPTFRVHWAVSLTGFLACVAAMLMINAGAALLALLCCSILFGFMKRRRIRASWGDVRRGFWAWIGNHALTRLDRLPEDERSWSPNLLVFSGLPSARWHLIEVAEAIVGGKGFMTAALVLPLSVEPERRTAARKAVRDYLDRREVKAFVKTISADSQLAGAQALADGYGFGSLKPNTFLLGDTAREENLHAYAAFLRRLQKQKKNVIIVRETTDGETDADETHPANPPPGRIDVWWQGKGPNAWFMLAIAYPLSLYPEWSDSPLRLNTVVHSEGERREAQERLTGRIREARIEAEGQVWIAAEDIFSTVREASQHARLCLFGLRPCADDEPVEAYAEYYETLMKRSEGLPLTLFVLASESVAFSRIFQ